MIVLGDVSANVDFSSSSTRLAVARLVVEDDTASFRGESFARRRRRRRDDMSKRVFLFTEFASTAAAFLLIVSGRGEGVRQGAGTGEVVLAGTSTGEGPDDEDSLGNLKEFQSSWIVSDMPIDFSF